MIRVWRDVWLMRGVIERLPVQKLIRVCLSWSERAWDGFSRSFALDLVERK